MLLQYVILWLSLFLYFFVDVACDGHVATQIIEDKQVPKTSKRKGQMTKKLNMVPKVKKSKKQLELLSKVNTQGSSEGPVTLTHNKCK